MKQLIYSLTMLLLISCGQDSVINEVNEKDLVKVNDVSQTKLEEKIHERQKNDIDNFNKPVDVALKFINSYADNSNKMNEGLGTIEWVDLNELSSDNFKKEVRRVIQEAREEDPELGLGFDPIFYAQDHDNLFELEKLKKIDNKTYYVEVRGKDWSGFKVTLKVVLENNEWLIDGCGFINVPSNERNEK